jgi:hypothetical protein
MKRYNFLLILLALYASTTSVFAQKSADIPVTSTFEDTYTVFDPVTNTTTTNVYRLRSDATINTTNKVVRPYLHGKESVSSVIQGIGDWALDMSSSATRKVNFDFGSVIENTNTNNVSAPDSGPYPTRILAQCSVRNGNKLQNLKVGDAPIYCPTNARIFSGSQEYSIRFRNEFGGTDVAWTCTSMTATTTPKCNGWRMQSGPDGSIARLLLLTTSKGKTTIKEGSLYNFTFDVNVTAP